MTNLITVSQLVRNGKRALAVATFGLLLGVVAVPQVSQAATIHPPQHVTPIVHPDDGSGDSPAMP